MSQSQSPNIYVHVYGDGQSCDIRGGYQGGRGRVIGRGGHDGQGGRGGGVGRGGRGGVGGKIRQVRARPRCNNCSLVGHAASVCWTKPSETAAVKAARAARSMNIALELKSRAEVVSKAAASVVAAAAAAETAANEAMSRALKLKAAIAAETPLPTTTSTPKYSENDKYKSNNTTDGVNNSC